MRAIFGVVSLLVVLAIVGIVAKKQLQAVHSVGASLPPTTNSDGTVTAAPAASTVRAQSQEMQRRAVDDVNKALQQGIDRNEAADK